MSLPLVHLCHNGEVKTKFLNAPPAFDNPSSLSYLRMHTDRLYNLQVVSSMIDTKGAR